MKLTKAITAFLEELKVAGRSPLTRTAYESDLTRLKALIPLDTILHVTPEAIRHFLAVSSAEGKSLATLHRRLAAIRTFGRWGVKRGLWTRSPAEDLDPIRKPKNLPRPFTDDEVTSLLALDLPPREALVRSLLLYTGLRVTPLASIKIGDLSYLPPTIRVLVKGAKQQVIKMHPALADQVKGYVREHTDQRAFTFLLAAYPGHRPHSRDIQRMVSRWAMRAGVRDCTPHRFRHTFGTKLLRITKDLRLVQQAMGHESIASTALYTQVTDEAEASAIAQMEWGKA